MGKLTGTRNTGRAKAIGGGILAGLAALGEAAHDGPRLARINEIDDTIVELRREKDFLISELYEPGDLKVSDDYDQYWRPTSTTASEPSTGRLTQCPGKDWYDKPHPGCPYKAEEHIKHEFTLND